METGGKKKRDLNATGGRIGFKDGMSRRRNVFKIIRWTCINTYHW
jgi:hypothetical protein